MSEALVIEFGTVGFAPSGTRRQAERERAEAAAFKASVRAEAEGVFRSQLQQDRTVQKERCRQCGLQFDGFIGGMREEISRRVVELSLGIAEILIRHQLPDREMLAGLIRQTLDPISDLQGCRVRLNPKDAQSIREGVMTGAVPQIVSESVEIVADPALKVGDMVIESRNGIIDARLEQRLALVAETLAKKAGGGDASPGNTTP